MKQFQYNYLIVGCGLFGSVFANEIRKKGFSVLVIDKRNNIAGNIYTYNEGGINVHAYGPHIFHTNDKFIWDYVNQLAEFKQYCYTPIASYNGRFYNLPFNMNTFYQLWGVKTPLAAMQVISEQSSSIEIPKNLEEQAIKMVGTDIYNILIKGYTQKQWGREPKHLPASIIKRLPVRFTFDNNYFNDVYQGIPVGGYTRLIEKLLDGSEVRLKTDYFSDRDYFNNIAEKVVFTGPIDSFYNYRFGQLEYRSLRFEHKIMQIDNFQGAAVVNYTGLKEAYTRVIEHKHFEGVKTAHSIITKEYPDCWKPGKEAYYPINDIENNSRFKKYSQLAEKESNIIFGGRLAEYRYYDMHQVIAAAIKKAR